MASRMDRYKTEETKALGRSAKNKSLYDQIQDIDSYTNIEGVATIEKTNEIDISKVQQLLKNRENYKKQRQYDKLVKKEPTIKKEPVIVQEEEKNYDVNDLLSKVKPNSEAKYRSLDEDQYEALKKLNKKNYNYDVDKEETELKELINTITSDAALNKLKDSDDVGLLDDLKSDTMVGDASSIKKILEEEKNLEKTDTLEMDKSFYTASLGLTKADFEELKDANTTIKSTNKFIIILLIIVIVMIAFVAIILL